MKATVRKIITDAEQAARDVKPEFAQRMRHKTIQCALADANTVEEIEAILVGVTDELFEDYYLLTKPPE